MLNRLLNILLLAAPFTGNIHALFYDTKIKWSLGIFVNRPTRLDYWFLHYEHAIQFLIVGFALAFAKHLNKHIVGFFFVMCVLDFIDLALFSKQFFVFVKLFTAIVIYSIYAISNKK